MIELKDQPFTVVGINSDQSRSALKQTIEKEKINWPNFHDGSPGTGPIANQWNVQGWPTIYVLDHEGKIRYRDTRGPALRAAVLELLKTTPGAKPLKD